MELVKIAEKLEKEIWDKFEKYGVNPSCKNSKIIKLFEAEPEKWTDFPSLEKRAIEQCIIEEKFNPAKKNVMRVDEIKEKLKPKPKPKK